MSVTVSFLVSNSEMHLLLSLFIAKFHYIKFIQLQFLNRLLFVYLVPVTGLLSKQMCWIKHKLTVQCKHIPLEDVSNKNVQLYLVHFFKQRSNLYMRNLFSIFCATLWSVYPCFVTESRPNAFENICLTFIITFM